VLTKSLPSGSSSGCLSENIVSRVADIKTNVYNNPCILTLAHEMISLLSLLLSVHGCDGEALLLDGSTKEATLAAMTRTAPRLSPRATYLPNISPIDSPIALLLAEQTAQQ
jgi:hypothetical protein